MPNRPMTPLTLSVYTLVTANGCCRIDVVAPAGRDCCSERGRHNV